MKKINQKRIQYKLNLEKIFYGLNILKDKLFKMVKTVILLG